MTILPDGRVEKSGREGKINPHDLNGSDDIGVSLLEELEENVGLSPIGLDDVFLGEFVEEFDGLRRTIIFLLSYVISIITHEKIIMKRNIATPPPTSVASAPEAMK